MFLTRAFEIINKEGVLTFRYALGQKMRENMTDEKIYQLYIKNVEPRQNVISENQCVQVVSVKENNTVKQVMEAVEKYLQNMLYCVVLITNCVRIMRKKCLIIY